MAKWQFKALAIICVLLAIFGGWANPLGAKVALGIACVLMLMA